MVLQPLEEPTDSHGLNDHFPTRLSLVWLGLSAIPVIGLAVITSSIGWYFVERDENAYNMAEVARKEGIYGAFLQAISLAVLVLVSL